MDTSPLADLQVGDRVQVFDVNGSRKGQPKGGWDGIVVKVGRKLITVDYVSARQGGDVFRIDTGYRNDDYAHQYLKTVEQAAASLRRGKAVERLRNGGLELTPRVEIPTETLEALVAVLERKASDK